MVGMSTGQNIIIDATKSSQKNQEVKDIRHSGISPPYMCDSSHARIALNELVHALKNPAPASPFRNIADKHIAEILDLQNISRKDTLTKYQQNKSKHNQRYNQ